MYCKKKPRYVAFLFQTYQHFFLTTFAKTSTFRPTFATEMNTFGICFGRLMRKCEKKLWLSQAKLPHLKQSFYMSQMLQ